MSLTLEECGKIFEYTLYLKTVWSKIWMGSLSSFCCTKTDGGLYTVEFSWWGR